MKDKTLLISFLASIALLFCGFTHLAMAQIPNTSYTLNGTILIKWIGAETIIDMESDSHLSKVTAIGERAFFRNRALKEIVLPKGLKTLGIRSFMTCTALTKIVIPEGVTTIPEKCFLIKLGSNLTEVDLPSTVTRLESECFLGNAKLSKFVLRSTDYVDFDSDIFENDGTDRFLTKMDLFVPKQLLEQYKAKWGDIVKSVQPIPADVPVETLPRVKVRANNKDWGRLIVTCDGKDKTGQEEFEAPVGADLRVSASPTASSSDHSYSFVGWKLNGKPYISTTESPLAMSIQVSSDIIADGIVDIEAVFERSALIQKARIMFGVNDPKLGTLSVSLSKDGKQVENESQVEMGESIDFAASPSSKEYELDHWVINGKETPQKPQVNKLSIKLDEKHVMETEGGKALEVKAVFVDRPRPVIPKGLVIAELFPTGTKTPDGKQFDDDKYVVLYNQSESTIYLDGICLSTSEYLTNLKIKPEPNIMATDVAIDAILSIPGSGRDYPLEPKKYCIIVDNAADHRLANPLSWDANQANFEFFWPGEHDDIDNPDVPNMDIVYDYIVMNNQASQAFVLWKMPEGMSREQYLKDYTYYYHWIFQQDEIIVKMEEDCYRVPNDWVIDVVSFSPYKDFEWSVVDHTLDAGYTYCADIGLSEDRYFHAVRRKVDERNADKQIIRMRDNNDSKDDFRPMTRASLLPDAPALWAKFATIHFAANNSDFGAMTVKYQGVDTLEKSGFETYEGRHLLCVAKPKSDQYILSHWLINGQKAEKANDSNELNLELAESMINADNRTEIQAVFVSTQDVSSISGEMISVRSYPTGLEIHGALHMPYSIYTMDGRISQRGIVSSTSQRITLPQGVYLVKIGTKYTTKVYAH